jgi:hypothetical protein
MLRTSLLSVLIVLVGATSAVAAVPSSPTLAETLARAKALHVGAEAKAVRRSFLRGARLIAGGDGATLGRTRLGGRPDLQGGAKWPTCGGRPLSFLAQIDLSELNAAVPGATRGHGLLSVFADLREDADGVPPIEEFYGRLRAKACGVAIRRSTGSRAGLRRLAATPRAVHTLRATPVRLRPTLTVPNWSVIDAVLGHRLSQTQSDRWATFADEASYGILGRRPPIAPVHQLLGWSTPIQDDPTYGCGGETTKVPSRRLLLQLDFDPALRFAIGDGGGLYLTITPRDLHAGRFDRLCAEFQEG